MMGIPRVFRNQPKDGQVTSAATSVAIAEGAVGGIERFASLAVLFPDVGFEAIGPDWNHPAAKRFDIVVIGVSATSPEEIDAAIRLAKASSFARSVVVALRNADVPTTRRLMREGVADVIPAPVSEPALALSLERLLESNARPAGGGGKAAGEIVAVLKAGGGVGATAICTQVAALLAGRGADVCVADLDLQFGAADVYLDLPDTLSVIDCLASGTGLAETPFREALSTHRSGLRLMAAPREVVALETLAPASVEALLRGLKRDFALTLVDMPSAWTAWTNQILGMADRIVMVTHLTVPHVQLVKRQLRILATQGHEAVPLTLVCNSLSSDQTASVSVKAAEKALGRSFQVVIPEDRRTMMQAINQGVQISSIRRGTKIEKALSQLAEAVGAPALASASTGRG